MKITERIAQSQIRVGSGIRLVGFLLLVVVCAFILDVLWLVKVSGAAAGFFTFATFLEYWNVRRLSRRL
jgi:hypothetical protein